MKKKIKNEFAHTHRAAPKSKEKNIVDRLTEQYAVGFCEGEKAMLKACGGCKQCFGKGYGTSIYGTTGLTDFGALKRYKTPMKINMVFCECARGKALKHLLTQSNLGINIKSQTVC